MERPILAITMGDPASIGPEITVKALARQEIYQICRPLVVGDACMLERARRVTGLEDIRVHRVTASTVTGWGAVPICRFILNRIFMVSIRGAE